MRPLQLATTPVNAARANGGQVGRQVPNRGYRLSPDSIHGQPFLVLPVFNRHEYKLIPEGVIMSATCDFDASGVALFGDEGQQDAYVRLAAELGYRSLLAAAMDWQGCRERRARTLAVRFSNGSIEHQRAIADGFLAWLRVARIWTGEPWQPSRRDFDAIHGSASPSQSSGKKAA